MKKLQLLRININPTGKGFSGWTFIFHNEASWEKVLSISYDKKGGIKNSP